MLTRQNIGTAERVLMSQQFCFSDILHSGKGQLKSRPCFGLRWFWIIQGYMYPRKSIEIFFFLRKAILSVSLHHVRLQKPICFPELLCWKLTQPVYKKINLIPREVYIHLFINTVYMWINEGGKRSISFDVIFLSLASHVLIKDIFNIFYSVEKLYI